MSTFFGGEQLLGKFEAASTGSNSNIYTVPAGRYAKIITQEAGEGGNTVTIDFGNSQVVLQSNTFIRGRLVTSGGSDLGTGGEGTFQEIYMSSGDVLGISGGDWVFHILEYANPN